MTHSLRIIAFAIVAFLLLSNPAHAYIGPGAGFTLAGSFFAIFLAMATAFVMVLTWPLRLLYRALLGKRTLAQAKFKRIVILGLDGLDYGLTSQWLEEGKLPNLARLKDQGSFHSLRSTIPPISPVAWSTFQTGVNPGKHNIFDFLFPDEQSYRPKISSVEIHAAERGNCLSNWFTPLATSGLRSLRKSTPFWNVLSQYGIFNCVIRVPISFPPEKLHGVQLSAMCVPDLRGTQGEFTRFTTKRLDQSGSLGGKVIFVERRGQTVKSMLSGPPHPTRPQASPLQITFQVAIHDSGQATLKIDGRTFELPIGEYTDWIQLPFRYGIAGRVWGICKFVLLATEPDFELYVTPINIDPSQPAMPIGYPSAYPIYLAKRQGSYATLGLAEDTWGLNENVLSDEQFLEQCQGTDRERESMFLDSLDRVRRGLCVCVFDGTDRMQHMFWRYQDETHPARPPHVTDSQRDTIRDLYGRMDELVGRTMKKCEGTDTLLMVLSDHGFNSYRRGIDLNRWLEENGYLTVSEDQRDEEYLAGIQWAKTRAFAIGLTGIFLNHKDRFSQGVVESTIEANQLREEIAQRLEGLIDPETGRCPFKHIYRAEESYRGPYKNRAPDLIIGYDRGYRVSWEAANGQTSRQIFHPNARAWSGDHCVDPSVVPGVLFCSQPLLADDPRLLDIAPTVLDLFGIEPPPYMDGQPLKFGVHGDAQRGA